MGNRRQQRANKELLQKIAVRIKELRERKGVSQEDFITDTGINIGRIESSKSNFSVSTLEVICNYFEITLKDFFSEGF